MTLLAIDIRLLPSRSAIDVWRAGRPITPPLRRMGCLSSHQMGNERCCPSLSKRDAAFARTNRTCVTFEGMAKHSNDILAWARRGAEVRWNELQAEVASLLKAFPDLATISKTARRTIAKSARGVADTLEPKRKRSKMSAAQRKAVSARMKKYWAEQRKAAKK